MIRDDLSIDDPASHPEEDPAPQRSWMRFLPAGIALGAIALFGGVVGYTYMSRGGAADGPVPLVRADARPAKVKPDSPGGMEVPHQDKEIYQRLAQQAPPPPPSPKVERLLPPPEAPMPKPAATPAPPPPVAAIPAAPEVKPPANAVPVPMTPPAMAAAPPPPPAVAKAPEAKPAEPPKVATTPPEAKQVEAPKVAAPKPAPAPEPKQLASIQPAAGAAAAGAFRVQIASLRTTEDAAKSWEKLKTTNPDLLGKLSGNVVRADLGDKGTFYRVVAGPFSDRDAASELCAKLKQRNVGCLVVKP
jgi:hypothetical protein